MTTFFTLLGFFCLYEIVHAQVLRNLLEVEPDSANMLMQAKWHCQDDTEDSTES